MLTSESISSRMPIETRPLAPVHPRPLRPTKQTWEGKRAGPVVSWACPGPLYRRLERLATKERRSRSSLVLVLVEEALAARSRAAASPPERLPAPSPESETPQLGA